MNNRIVWAEIIGLVGTIVFSFVFHNMYEWIKTLGWLFPVNESLWEHIKIIFMPYLIFAVVELFIIKPQDKLNYFAIKSLSLIIMPIVMIILFYTYSGIIGRNYMFIDILIGIITIIIGFIISAKLLLIEYKFQRKLPLIITASVILLLLIIFTYIPPRINLFFDHLEHKYGR